MNKHYDFIKMEYTKLEYNHHYDIYDIKMFLKYIKLYLFYPLYYKKYDEKNIEYIVSKINTLLKKISAMKINVFYENLHLIHKKLMDTIDMIKNNDPSCFSEEEIVLSYPSFYAIFSYRIAHLFYEQKEYILARLISEHAHMETAIDIHPGAKIGDNFFIDHGSGIVIGETSVIGDNCKIYHGVTLGSKFNGEDNDKRHPTIEDNVIIYANASIIGGNTIIKKNSIIGMGVVIKNSVSENSIVKKRSDY